MENLELKVRIQGKMSTNLLKKLLIFSFVILNVTGLPLSPCPRNFHYELDDEQLIGVVKIYPRIYNSFRTNRITTIVVMLIAGHVMPGRVGSIEFYHSLADTYDEIAMKQPVMYRIHFPEQTMTPILVEILVNNVRVCVNRKQQQAAFRYSSRIQLQHTFYLPPKNTYNGDSHSFDATNEQPMPSDQLLFQPEAAPPLSPLMASDDDNPAAQDLSTHDAAICGRTDAHFKLTHLIMGGDKIPRATWPWLVAIFLKDAGAVSFLCTGSLVADRIVLTAGHCFRMYDKENERKPTDILLVFGRYDLRNWTEPSVQLSDAESINIHPDYVEGELDMNDADIAVVVTTRRISYNSFVRPICLWPSSTMVQNVDEMIGRSGTLVGWGPRLTVGLNLPRKLQMPIVQKSNCFSRSKLNREMRTFCAGSRVGSGPCSGDSGTGFALWQNGAWFLRGIVSAAIGDPILNRCELNTFIILTDVTRFRQWINTFIVFAVK